MVLDLASDASIERDVRAWLEHFRDSDVTPFTIPVDEPHTDEARALLACERLAAITPAVK